MKKLSEPVKKVNSQVVGLDVHKRMTVFCVFDSEGRTLEEGRFRTNGQELDTFLERILAQGETHFAFEASRSSLWMYERINQYVDTKWIHVAQAKRIQAIANSKEKNDGNDAWWLAYLTFEGRLPEAYVPPAQVLELRVATRERICAVRQRTKIINRMKAHLAQLGEITPGASIRSEQARLFLAEKALETPGARGRALRSCLEELDFQEQAISEWEEVIDEVAAGLPEVEIIEKEMPGFGKILASVVVAECGDITRFRSAKAFGKHSGLTPSDHSTSGRTIHGGISREGSSHLRWALTQAAMACLRARSGPGLAAGNWIRAKDKRMGIKAKARAAGARKLAEAIWRLFCHGECFDPAKPFGARAMTH